MIGFVFAIAAAAMYSVRGVLSKSLQGGYGQLSIIAVSRILSVIPILLVVVLTGKSLNMPLTPQTFFYLSLSVVLGSLGNIFMMKALEAVPVVIFNSMNKVGIVLTAVLSAVFLHEAPTGVETILMALILIVCISLVPGDISFTHLGQSFTQNKGFVYVILTQLAFSTLAIAIRNWTQLADPIVIAFYTSIGQGLILLPFAIGKEKLTSSMSMFVNYRVILLAAATGLAIMLAFSAKKYVPAPIADTLIATDIMFTLLISSIFMNKERYSVQTNLKFMMILASAAGIALL